MPEGFTVTCVVANVTFEPLDATCSKMLPSLLFFIVILPEPACIVSSKVRTIFPLSVEFEALSAGNDAVSVGTTASIKTADVLPMLFSVVIALSNAAFWIVAPLVAIALPRVIPLVSSWLFNTVYRKVAPVAPETVPESKAWTVVTPIVTGIEGIPPEVLIVTAWLKVTVKSRFCPVR